MVAPYEWMSERMKEENDVSHAIANVGRDKTVAAYGVPVLQTESFKQGECRRTIRSRSYLTGRFRLFSNSNVESTFISFPFAFLKAFVHRTCDVITNKRTIQWPAGECISHTSMSRHCNSYGLRVALHCQTHSLTKNCSKMSTHIPFGDFVSSQSSSGTLVDRSGIPCCRFWQTPCHARGTLAMSRNNMFRCAPSSCLLTRS